MLELDTTATCTCTCILFLLNIQTCNNRELHVALTREVEERGLQLGNRGKNAFQIKI